MLVFRLLFLLQILLRHSKAQCTIGTPWTTVTGVTLQNLRVSYGTCGLEPRLYVKFWAKNSAHQNLVDIYPADVSYDQTPTKGGASPQSFNPWSWTYPHPVYEFDIEIWDANSIGPDFQRAGGRILVQGGKSGLGCSQSFNHIILTCTSSDTLHFEMIVHGTTDAPTKRPTDAPTPTGVFSCSDYTHGVQYVDGQVHGCSGTFTGGVLSHSAASLCGIGWSPCDRGLATNRHLQEPACSTPAIGSHAGKFFATTTRGLNYHDCNGALSSGTGNDDVYGCGDTSLAAVTPTTQSCFPFNAATVNSVNANGWSCPAGRCDPTMERLQINHTDPTTGGVLCCVYPCSNGLPGEQFVKGAIYGCAGSFTGGPQGAEGLCATGWHVCKTEAEVAGLGLTAATCKLSGGTTWYASLEAGQTSSCATDVHGCGSMLDFVVDVSNCGVFSTKAGDFTTTFKPLQPSPTFPGNTITSWSCEQCNALTPYDEYYKLVKLDSAWGGVMCCVNEPTKSPTPSPSDMPSRAPTTTVPSAAPSDAPTTVPSNVPSDAPTTGPSSAPSQMPSAVPSAAPTTKPSSHPSTSGPTSQPSTQPSTSPTKSPTLTPGTARFNGSSQAHAGRVEISVGGVWGTVCSNGWTLANCEVVCRGIQNTGAKSVEVLSTTFGAGVGPVHLTDVNCTGQESTLLHCPHSTTVGATCNNHGHDAGCVCCLLGQPCGTTPTPVANPGVSSGNTIQQTSNVQAFDGTLAGIALGVALIALVCVFCLLVVAVIYCLKYKDDGSSNMAPAAQDEIDLQPLPSATTTPRASQDSRRGTASVGESPHTVQVVTVANMVDLGHTPGQQQVTPGLEHFYNVDINEFPQPPPSEEPDIADHYPEAEGYGSTENVVQTHGQGADKKWEF